jgi:hypothetical protein
MKRVVCAFVVVFTAIVLATISTTAGAQLVAAEGYRTEHFCTPYYQLDFRVGRLGAFTLDGVLLAVSADAVHPAANHNVLGILPNGNDFELVPKEKYPTDGGSYEWGRLGYQIILDPADPDNFALMVDAGSLANMTYANGRIFRIDLHTGDVSVVVDYGVLHDPISLEAHPVTGDVYVTDRGRRTVAGDGRIVVLDESTSPPTLTTVMDGIDPIDIHFLEGDAFLYTTSTEAADVGIFRVDGSGTTKVSDLRGLLTQAPGGPFGTSTFVTWGNSGGVVRLIDLDGGDFTVDATEWIIESGSQGGITFDANGVMYATDGLQGEVPYAIHKVLPEVTSVAIDIKPNDYPNVINLGSRGVVPVAVLSTPDFDATSIDPATVTLAGAGVALRGKADHYLASIDDIDGDGLLDLLLHVETENFVPGAFQDGAAWLTGSTYAGQGIEGWDEITIVPPE